MKALKGISKLINNFLEGYTQFLRDLQRDLFPEVKKPCDDDIARNFRVEIEQTFWGTKTKWIQREKPLTDDELKLMKGEHKQ